MKDWGIADRATSAALQLDWLEREIEPVSEYGRRVFTALAPFAPGEESAAAARMERVATLARGMASAALEGLREALGAAPDVDSAIAWAAAGDALRDADFLALQRFLDALARAHELSGDDDLDPKRPAVARVREALAPGRSGECGFYLADDFDPALSKARAAAAQAQSLYDEARGRVASRVAVQLGREEAAHEFIVMRDDLRETLPKEVRVIREAPTYLLCELELDEDGLAALASRDAASERCARLEEEVRARLSAAVCASAPDLERLTQCLGHTDVLFAQVRFAQRHACVAAQIVPEAGLEFAEARFLPLAAELVREGRAYVPVSLKLPNVAVLTGPNMGGKSVALRTAGTIALLAAFGIPVPARSARLPLFGRIAWLGIGAESTSGGLLSSFAGEVRRLRDILAAAEVRTVVLLDEFARTTTPSEGRALLVAVLQTLLERKITAFVATHLSGVAEAAGVTHFAVRGLRGVPHASEHANLHEALAALAASMDYSIVEVTGDREPHADAIALAQLLGLDEGIISAARRALESSV